MFCLFTGGSGSGKSSYAENIITKLQEKELYYIATMYPVNRESQEKVDRHRRMRKGKGFKTLECYTDLKNVDVPENSVVLLECMSNLLANEMFQEEGAKERAVEEIMQGIRNLESKVKHLFVVTNEVFSDGNKYEEDMTEYIENLGHINQCLAEMADGVAEIVFTIPIYHKGAECFEDHK